MDTALTGNRGSGPGELRQPDATSAAASESVLSPNRTVLRQALGRPSPRPWFGRKPAKSQANNRLASPCEAGRAKSRWNGCIDVCTSTKKTHISQYKQKQNFHLDKHQPCHSITNEVKILRATSADRVQWASFCRGGCELVGADRCEGTATFWVVWQIIN